MAAITGAMSTTNVLSDQLAIDLGDTISHLEANYQPLCVFTRKAGKARTTATKFSWLEEASKARFLTKSGTANTTVTDIVLAANQGKNVQQWDQLLNTRTGEQFRVDGVSGDTASCTRGIGPSPGTGVAMLDGDEIMIIGTAQPEGDTSKPARSDVPTKVSNNTQIFRTPLEITGSLQASSFQVSPAEWPRQMRNKTIEHAKDLEYAFNFGRKSVTTPGANEARTMGGLLSFISTNQTDAGGDLSEAEWNAAMLQQGRYSTGERLSMASGVGIAALNKFPASKQQTRNDETTYGMDVTRFTGPFGSVNVVWHKLYEGTKYGGIIVNVDMSEVKYRYLANDEVNRDTKVLPNRGANDLDGTKSEILSEVSLQVGLEKKHGIITGVTS